jgi:Arc/MetJ family transcription regulator
MRTTVDIPEDLLARAMSASGAKTTRDAVRWALEEALRRMAIEDLVSRKVKLDFAVTPEDLEAREIKRRSGSKRPRSRR